MTTSSPERAHIAGGERWLVTGAGGLLGANAIMDLAASGSEVVAFASAERRHSSIPLLAADLSNVAERGGLVERHAPSVVLHSAAVSSIEACEKDPDLAWRLNVEASADLAKQARKANAKYIFISTDAVFDGTQGPYDEDDPVSPTTAYGRTKVAAEEAVLHAHPQAIVARVNFFGWSPAGSRSIAEYFYTTLERGDDARGFTDISVSTLYVRDLVDALRGLIAADVSGIFHVASSEPTSKYEFGRRLAIGFGWDPSRVVPTKSIDHLEVARGARLDLNVAKTELVLGNPMPSQSESMHRLVADATQNRRTQLGEFARTP